QEDIDKRINEVTESIQQTGTYRHTTDELIYGAKMAWRNSNRCIGRLFWESLNVNDARDITEESNFIDSICNHIEKSTNGGKIKPYITIF
ncbi:nitric oxide synthase oxygenase, partial [Staphylococcus capitis]